ncbi:hypothetical protein [Beggiatoa leptomitoformis]|uniref:Uncharacterized protein n=1 Tax=Beggiatoa leptomitoformis TaxID=288004 RepID=A0A2N9YBI9_9GAMM|nr:hypothetical protein [Beggiatoa leptomitoformis]ALG66814.1 hypothetical protein AL038_02645 [Beggiatoa leptomitoformis]AUI67837.1 hypothetical protein BLE401_03400 [Beggiatoa leptomitoformis]
MYYPITVILLLVPIAFLTTCSPPNGDKQVKAVETNASVVQQATSQTTVSHVNRMQKNINIKQLDIVTLDTYPMRVNAIAQIELPNNCLLVSDITEEIQNDTFNLTLLPTPQNGVNCQEQPQLIEQIISLNIQGLKSGVYTVNLNEASAEFILMVDSVL